MILAVALFILFVIVCMIGLPIAFAIGFTTWAAFFSLNGKMLAMAQKMFSGVDSFTYLCIPLFVLAAEIMSEGKLIEKIVEFFNVLVGHIRGGLAYVNVLDSMVFAGISGSASADMASLGLIEVEMMDKAGYGRVYSTVVAAASATIAPVIPPSSIMILFAAAAGGLSVGKLFAGGFIPGAIYGIAQLSLCAYYAKKYNHPKNERASTFKEICLGTKRAASVLVLPAIIFFSIVLGICTATEAGAIAVFYAFIITFVTKKLSFKDYFKCLVNVGKLTTSVTFIVATATAMGWVVTALQIPQNLATFCLTYIDSATGFLIFVNLLLIFIGCFLDGAPAVLLLVPILFPVAMTYGINPIHFGIVVCLNLSLGLITPPIGMILFVSSNVTGVKLSELYRHIWPFVLVGLGVLLLVTYVPALSTFIPSLMQN